MKLPIFSKRHKKRLKDKSFALDRVTKAVKERIVRVMEKFDEQTRHSTSSGWNYDSTVLEDLDEQLCSEHGWPELKVYLPGRTEMVDAKIRDFLRFGAPQYVFDALELFSRDFGSQGQGLQDEINRIFSESGLPWLLNEGVLFHIDSEYMAEVASQASRLLAEQDFHGALEEFQKARSYYDAGDFKETVNHANLALESTMKAILGIDREKPGKLIRMMINNGRIPSYYTDFLKQFEQMLRVVNIPRNEELGAGHGQGKEVCDVAPHLAELVLNFCGSLIVYLVREEVGAEAPEGPNDELAIDEDSIPF
jgi:hypothetical protein